MDYTGMTVAEILAEKLGSIRVPGLPKGSPSWDDILDMTWEEVVQSAKRREPGFKTIKKLLGSQEYNR